MPKIFHKPLKHELKTVDDLPHGQTEVEVVSGTSGRTYKVDIRYLTCSCPAFTFRKKSDGRYCKHLHQLGYSQSMVQGVHEKVRVKRAKTPRIKITPEMHKAYSDLL